MDFAYQGRHPPAQLAAMAAKFNSDGDQTWFADSGASNHITVDMNNLELSVPYLGGDEITVGNGSGLCITHTGFSTLKSSNSKFLLKKFFRCPQFAANLLSIQKFCKNNNCWFALTANFFFFFLVVKDMLTGQILLQGPSKEGLYPIKLPSSINKVCKQIALLGVIATSSIWHARLGHLSSKIFSC